MKKAKTIKKVAVITAEPVVAQEVRLNIKTLKSNPQLYNEIQPEALGNSSRTKIIIGLREDIRNTLKSGKNYLIEGKKVFNESKGVFGPDTLKAIKKVSEGLSDKVITTKDTDRPSRYVNAEIVAKV
jgi:hypothetical protein